MPMQGDSELPFWTEGQPKPTTQAQMTYLTLSSTCTTGLPKAMGIPLERGRFLTPSVTTSVLRRHCYRRTIRPHYFPNENPVGKHVNFELFNTSAEIVGVTGHVKQWGLDADSISPVQAQCYLALPQTPDRFLSSLPARSGRCYVPLGHRRRRSRRLAAP